MCIVMNAARHAIKPQLVAFKIRALHPDSVCHFSGVPLTFETAWCCHVDVPFKEIFARFVADKGIDIDNVLVNNLRGRLHLSDPVLRRQWFAFHLRHAQFALVDHAEWMRRNRGEPNPELASEREQERLLRQQERVAMERAFLQSRRDAEVVARYWQDAA